MTAPPVCAQVCEDGLYSLRVQDNGRLVACGSRQGVATLLDVSPGLSTLQRNEKSLVSAVSPETPPRHQGQEVTSHLRPEQMFERETKREKILEARQRELRLKERSRSQQSREDEAPQDDAKDGPDQLIARAESDFYSTVEAELKKARQVRPSPPTRCLRHVSPVGPVPARRGRCETPAPLLTWTSPWGLEDVGGF